MKNFIMVIFAGITLKLFKVGPPFSSFNPCSSCPSVATDDRKQFRCLNIVLNNKTGPLWFRRVNSIDAKKVLAFKRIADGATELLLMSKNSLLWPNKIVGHLRLWN